MRAPSPPILLYPCISTRQAAARLGVTPGRVRQFVMGGRLVPVKIGRDNFFRPADVAALVRRRYQRS